MVRRSRSRSRPAEFRPQHQNSYKLIYSHQDPVRDLLTGFGEGALVQQLDMDTLEWVNTSLVTDDLRDREDDIIWRVRWKETWLYVFILLEFQSTVDPFMAVRILVYVGLLWQDIIRTQDLKAGDLLPPVLPIVLYNGEQQWTGPIQVAELVESAPDGMSVYIPRLQYVLVDEGAYSDEELKAIPNNLAAAMFRIENSRDGAVVGEVVGQIDAILGPEQQSLRRALLMWILRVVLATKLPGEMIPEVQNLAELKDMIKRERNWEKWWTREGERVVLLRLLRRRFGPVDEQTEKRIGSTDSDLLLEWADRVLTAERIEDVFA